MKAKFPEELYVSRERESDPSSFIMAEKSMDDLAIMGQPVRCAIYKLVKVVTLQAQVIAK